MRAFALIALFSTLLASAAATAAAPVTQQDQQEQAAKALHTLLDSEWEWRLAQFPERATTIGDHRFDDRLTDRSPDAVAARRAHHAARLSAIRAIDRAQLQGEDRLSWDILAFNADLDVSSDTLWMSTAPGGNAPWSADDSPMSVNQMSGPQFNLPQLVRATRFRDEADYRHYLARLQALPENLSQLQAQLDAGRRAGWMPPKVALERLPSQFAPLLGTELAKHPLYAPFLTFPADLPLATQSALKAAAEQTLRTSVIPSCQGFRDFLVSTWIPAATASLEATKLPKGAEYYALSLQR